MKRILITTIVSSLVLLSLVHAQEHQFKLSKKTGTLKVYLTGAKIEGYDGNEIVFSAPERKEEGTDERAEGLKLISGSGATDNTGLGISVEEKDNAVNVRYVSKRNQDLITIKVPNSMSIVVKTSDVMFNKPFDIKNFKGELEIGVMYNTVTLENVTGPVNAKTIYGGLTAKFSQPIKGPISLVSVYTFVDATVPASLKANVNLSTQYGNVYAADGLSIKRETVKADSSSDDEDITGMTDWSRSSDIKGTLNGGGIDFILKSSYGKIYLRK
ncbi:MAG: hypothetical protein QM610_03745 [Chitinophagaceae bacterium]